MGNILSTPGRDDKLELRVCFSLKEFCLAQVIIVSATIGLGVLAYIFIYLTGHDHVFGFLRLFDVGSEQSIPTYISELNLLLSAVLLFLIYRYEKVHRIKNAKYWLFIAVVFLILSIDESAEIHEKFGNLNEFLIQQQYIPRFIDGQPWLLFGIIFVVVFVAVVAPFLWNLPSDTRFYFIVSGCVFVTGALGIEYLGSQMLESGLVESRKDLLYLVRGIFEDGFEMYGVVIFNCALYREILRRNFRLIVFDNREL